MKVDSTAVDPDAAANAAPQLPTARSHRYQRAMQSWYERARSGPVYYALATLIICGVGGYFTPLRPVAWWPLLVFAAALYYRQVHRVPPAGCSEQQARRWWLHHWSSTHVCCAVWGYVFYTTGSIEQAASMPVVVAAVATAALGTAICDGASLDRFHPTVSTMLLQGPTLVLFAIQVPQLRPLALTLGIYGFYLLGTQLKRRVAEFDNHMAVEHELLSLHASRTRMLASACHDLRQPAHALAMLAELAGDEPDPAERRLKLDGIRRCSSTLADMLGMLMDMTQLEGGHYAPAPQPLPLAELMDEVELQYGATARRKGLHFLVASTGAFVRSDRHMLRRILFNLVANAVKYTEAGSVQVLAQVQDDEVRLTVRDTGPGIPPDRLEDVFADHVRLDTSNDVEGMGIGLPIVKRAAELLGHALHMESTPGGGTAVTVTLARSEPPPGAALASPADRNEAAAGRLVALLEDDTECREAMASLLQRWGFRVLPAGDVRDLAVQLEAAAADVPELLVTDLHLRGGDALEAVRQLRLRPGLAGLPVLLVTGDVALEVTELARSQAIAVAHKPLMPQRLHAAIDQAIRSRGQAGVPATTA